MKTKLFKPEMVCLWAILLINLSASAATYYVTPLGAGLKNGTSWANAYDAAAFRTKLSSAVSGSEFWVAAGTYTPTALSDRTVFFTLPSGVKLYGGFLGTETLLSQRNHLSNVTILSGDIGVPAVHTDNSYTIIRINNASATTLLDGFTIRYAYGNAAWQGALFISGTSSPTIKNCLISNNTNTSPANSGSAGAGIQTQVAAGSSLLIDNCQFINNTQTGTEPGAAINIYASSLVEINIHNSVFSGNSNLSPSGGAICSFRGNINLYNSVFYNNSSVANGGALYITHIGNPTYAIKNCAFVENYITTSGGSGGAISLYPLAGTITNCIFYNNRYNTTNSTGAGCDIDAGNALNISNCITQAYGTNGVNGNKVGVNPIFVNAENPIGADNIWLTADDGLRLTCASPATDAGTSINMPATDITGLARPQGTAFDMGAYEYTPLAGDWKTTGTNNWHTASNWIGNAVPLAATNVCIVAGGVQPLISSGVATCNDLLIASGASLNNAGTLTVAGKFENYGTHNNSGIESSVNPLRNYGNFITTGTFTGNVNNLSGGIVSSNDANTGNIPITGSYSNGTKSKLKIKINGNAGVGIANGHDRLQVTGTATLGDTLQILYNAWPLVTGSYTILSAPVISGTFSSLKLPSNVTANLIYNATSVVLNVTSVLPLNLLSFTAQKKNNNVICQWSTANEINTSHFNIERSFDGRSFTTVGKVNASNRAGNNNYSFSDNVSAINAGAVFYRLQIVDNDGRSTYSKVVKVNLDGRPGISIAPNPAKDHITITGEASLVDVFDVNGKKIITRQLKNASTYISLSNLLKGVYIIRLTDISGRMQSEKLVIE